MITLKKLIKWIVLLGILAIIGVFGFTFMVYQIKDIGLISEFEKDFIEIPYRYSSSNHIIIDVEIKGKKYPFILDSGASNMVFSDSGVEDDGFRFFGFGIDSNGTPFFPILTKLNRFQIDELAFDDFTFARYSNSFLDCPDDGVGLIGKEAMRHYVWQFFPDEQMIRIAKNTDHILRSGNEETIRCSVGKFGHHLKAMVKIAADSSARYKRCFVDLGFNGSLTIPFDSSMMSLPRVESIGKGSKGLASVDNSRTWFGKTDQFHIESFHYEKDMDFFMTENSFKAIGLGFLKKFNFTLDWKGSQLILDPLPDKEVRLKWYGINLDFDKEGNLTVASIIENSKADTLSIQPLTQVVEVNKMNYTDIEDNCQLKEIVDSSDTLRISYIENEELKSAWFTKYYYLGD